MIESVEEFIRLRISEDPAEYRRAAHEPASMEVWSALIEDHPEMRFWVAQNKTIPLSILDRLARDPDPRVRSMVASKRKLSPELQLLLASDPDYSVRDRLLYNAKVEERALEKLAAGSDSVATEARRKLRER